MQMTNQFNDTYSWALISFSASTLIPHCNPGVQATCLGHLQKAYVKANPIFFHSNYYFLIIKLSWFFFSLENSKAYSNSMQFSVLSLPKILYISDAADRCCYKMPPLVETQYGKADASLSCASYRYTYLFQQVNFTSCTPEQNNE